VVDDACGASERDGGDGEVGTWQHHERRVRGERCRKEERGRTDSRVADGGAQRRAGRGTSGHEQPAVAGAEKTISVSSRVDVFEPVDRIA